ncbi:MAG: ATP-binding protein [Candidatus Cloacimonetes bacterium]|nr:ATP-binding protein [Candidatus Cloacimonadota bacterium]
MDKNQKSSKPHFKFKVGSALLSELGERLVAEPGIAFTELIKNAHDADATECLVILSKNKIIIDDNGHGMTKDEFEQNWMTIATSNKLEERFSRSFRRPLTGAKGVGRFSARFLGRHLKIETISFDKKEKINKILEVEFDWLALDKHRDVSEMYITYTYNDAPANKRIGTKLIITDLKHEVEEFNTKKIYTEILKLTSPFKALRPKKDLKGLYSNPEEYVEDGFNVNIDFSDNQEKESNEDNIPESIDVVSEVLKNYTGRVIIESIDKYKINIKIQLNNNTNTIVHDKTYNIGDQVNSNIYADIRYFPRRKGVFSGLNNLNGTQAWSWIRENSGVVVYDQNFRMKPYGEWDDDWLHLDTDNAHSERKWRTNLMEQEFPLTEDEKKKPKLNPVLYLPTNYQLVGAVYVQSSKDVNSESDLIPAMDRTGFLNNDGYKSLVEIIRFGIELLAKYDKDSILAKEKLENEKMIQQSKQELQAVIKHIESSHTMSMDDKSRLISVYRHLEENIDEIDAYNRESRESLEIMALLGAVAGFMTHEYQSTLFELQSAIATVKSLTSKHPELMSVLKNLEKSLEYFNGYIEYTTFFIRNIRQQENIKKIKVLPRIKYILNTFKQFREERNIKVDISEIYDKLEAPAMPIAMYDGIIHNLYSNSLKALLSYDERDNQSIIKINIWNDKNKHFIQVMDNGPGIPQDVKERIWDPLYTTTSAENNPLGSGMGIGLPMVKRVIEAQKGKIIQVDAPDGFNTCFRVELPFKEEK